MKAKLLSIILLLLPILTYAVDPLGSRVSHNFGREDAVTLVYCFIVIIAIIVFFSYALYKYYSEKPKNDKPKPTFQKRGGTFDAKGWYEEQERRRTKEDKNDKIGCGCFIVVIAYAFITYFLAETPTLGFTILVIVVGVLVGIFYFLYRGSKD